MKKALIIFQKNPVAGKTKTRLAATVGNDNALKIYNILVDHVHNISKSLECDKFLFFSDYLEQDVRWDDCELKVQSKDDLGSRMKNALDEILALDYSKAVLIGTDCFELSPEIINDAFDKLDTSNYVFGPALDGGYYLIGAKSTHDAVFLNKEWSHDKVLDEALKGVENVKSSYALVQTLSDVDTEDDLKELRQYLE